MNEEREEPAQVTDQDRRDVSEWLIKEANQRVRFFPQRRDGVDALMRHLAHLAATQRPDDVEPKCEHGSTLTELCAAAQDAWPQRPDDREATLLDSVVRLRRLDDEKFAEAHRRTRYRFPAPGLVNEVAVTLMAAWEAAEGKEVGASRVATFADMAEAVVVVHRAALAAGDGEATK